MPCKGLRGWSRPRSSRSTGCTLADRVVTARLAKPGTEETDWAHPGRRAMFFVLERDIHAESLEALQLPEFPPDLRERLHGNEARACRPQRVHIIEPRLLDRT